MTLWVISHRFDDSERLRLLCYTPSGNYRIVTVLGVARVWPYASSSPDEPYRVAYLPEDTTCLENKTAPRIPCKFITKNMSGRLELSLWNADSSMQLILQTTLANVACSILLDTIPDTVDATELAKFIADYTTPFPIEDGLWVLNSVDNSDGPPNAVIIKRDVPVYTSSPSPQWIAENQPSCTVHVTGEGAWTPVVVDGMEFSLPSFHTTNLAIEFKEDFAGTPDFDIELMALATTHVHSLRLPFEVDREAGILSWRTSFIDFLVKTDAINIISARAAHIGIPLASVLKFTVPMLDDVMLFKHLLQEDKVFLDISRGADNERMKADETSEKIGGSTGIKDGIVDLLITNQDCEIGYVDFVKAYPSIMCDTAPFLTSDHRLVLLFSKKLMEKREVAKKNGDKHAEFMYKRAANMLYGRLGCKNSCLFNRAVINTIAIVGQQRLHNAITAFEKAGAEVLCWQTDGFIYKMSNKSGTNARAIVMCLNRARNGSKLDIQNILSAVLFHNKLVWFGRTTAGDIIARGTCNRKINVAPAWRKFFIDRIIPSVLDDKFPGREQLSVEWETYAYRLTAISNWIELKTMKSLEGKSTEYLYNALATQRMKMKKNDRGYVSTARTRLAECVAALPDMEADPMCYFNEYYDRYCGMFKHRPDGFPSTTPADTCVPSDYDYDSDFSEPHTPQSPAPCAELELELEPRDPSSPCSFMSSRRGNTPLLPAKRAEPGSRQPSRKLL